jgi:Ca2+-transporting ATPase
MPKRPGTQTPSTGAAGSASAAPLWHALDAEGALATLEADARGLTEVEARSRLERHGPNVLPRARRDGPLDLLWRQIHTPLIWVLILSGGVAMIVDPTDGVKNGLVILAVVVLNTLIGFVQEWKAGRAIESLSEMVPETVAVLREGRRQERPASELVPGDVVLPALGDRVPADLRILAARNLQAEEAALTGESVPARKSPGAVAADAALGDRTCMLFAGTLVTSGSGTAIVVATGDATELGRISAMLRETTDLETPLTKALAQVGRTLTAAILVVAVAMLAIGTWRNMVDGGTAFVPALRETVIFAIALAVGAIPEGLPAIVTIALAVGVRRMASRRAVVRRLPAVETLGSTTVVCTDKTGTLTRNEMAVQEIWTPAAGAFALSGVGYEPSGRLLRDGTPLRDVPEDVRLLLLAGALCSDATLAREGEVWRMHGDPTEGALVVSAEKVGIGVDAARARFVRRDAIPFESENQFMATLHEPAPPVAGQEGVACILVKGAPEVVVARCSTAAGASLDASRVLREVERLAGLGMRVLAIAAAPVPTGRTCVEVDDVREGLTLLGLEGMIDPPRPEVIDAIQRCHEAGITVKMITGDHPATALAIGVQLALLSGRGDASAITGTALGAMTPEEIVDAVGKSHVFARVAPEHKLHLVQALQARGEVVAMTGDGVNDAPALKQANIGVAMGITGTSVARDSADIVLTDDNFASIIAAVEEGRRVYDNLVKSLAFVLPTNLGLAMVLMVGVALFPFGDVVKWVEGEARVVRELLLPMLPTQLLWINLVATVALALPLAFEAKEPNVMLRPPRRPERPVLSPFVIVRTFVAATLMSAGAVGLFLLEYQRELALIGTPGHEALTRAVVTAEAQTMAVTTIIFFQIFYVLNCRSLRGTMRSIGIFSNPMVFVGIAALLVLQALFIYAAPLNEVFGSAPLEPADLLLAMLVGAIILPVISIEKWDRNRRLARRSQRVQRFLRSST